MNGLFITLEGVEGSGKTTQLSRLKKHLESTGHRIVVTREPGGTPISEAIRDILLDPTNGAMHPMTELLLYEAARAQHVAEHIRPALESGAIVLSDRYTDSTTAYQGAGRSISPETVGQLHQIATQGVWPDLTIVIDLDPTEGLRRRADDHAHDRIESEPVDFHRQVRTAFLALAEIESERIKVVDGSMSPDEIAGHIAALVDPLVEQKRGQLDRTPE